MVMQIKGKFIQNATLDSSKILLKAGEALRIVAQDGSEKRLIELTSQGKVLVNGAEVALKSDIASTTASVASSLAAEVAAREAADQVLDGKIATEKSRAEAAEAALQSAITAEESRAMAAESSIRSDFAAADAGLAADIAAEAAARAAGDTSTLNSAKAYADQKVADLVNGAPAMLDTLKELSDAIASDAGFATTVANQIGEVASDLAAETSRAEAAEAALSASIAAEQSRAQGAESTLNSRIAAEETARASAVSAEASRAQAAEAALQAAISAEESARMAAISTEQSARAAAIAVEKSRAEAAEAGLSAAISAEQTRAEGAESALDARLDVIEGSGEGSVAKAKADAKSYADGKFAAEQSRAQAAEAGLASDIAGVASDLAAETSARQSAVSSVQSAIAAEETRAMGAESALDARLDVLEGSGEGSVAKAKQDAKDYADQKVAALVNSAPAVLDTLKELADAINGDQNFAATVAGQVGAVAADLATETSRAQSAEAGLASDIAAEASARAAAVSAEQARAEAAESALSGRVGTLEAKRSRKEKFTLTQTDIDNGFVEFAREAMVESVIAFVDRLAIHEGADQDFTMSVVAGKSRMTFVNNLVDPSPEKLSAGDVINVTYMA